MGKTVGCGCDYCMSRGMRRDFRHGASGDGWEDVSYRASRAAKKTKKKSKRVGCPENNGKAHVYVWTGLDLWLNPLDPDGWWSDYRGKKYRYEFQVCCGCLKRGPKTLRRVYK